MCGRFTSLLSPELLAEIFGITSAPFLVPRYNIAPTQQVPIIRAAPDKGRILTGARWGLVPHWAKDISIGSKMINARCETVHEKSAFRLAIRNRRCIIPVSGFYEWQTVEGGKHPHYVTIRDGLPFAVAGIWETWKSPEGEAIETCAILTTVANSLMAKLHDRMPVILHRAEYDHWLDRTVNDPQELKRLYQPYPADLMQEWEVSTVVNSAAHDTEECVRPIEVSQQQFLS